MADEIIDVDVRAFSVITSKRKKEPSICGSKHCKQSNSRDKYVNWLGNYPLGCMIKETLVLRFLLTCGHRKYE